MCADLTAQRTTITKKNSFYLVVSNVALFTGPCKRIASTKKVAQGVLHFISTSLYFIHIFSLRKRYPLFGRSDRKPYLCIVERNKHLSILFSPPSFRNSSAIPRKPLRSSSISAHLYFSSLWPKIDNRSGHSLFRKQSPMISFQKTILNDSYEEKTDSQLFSINRLSHR